MNNTLSALLTRLNSLRKFTFTNQEPTFEWIEKDFSTDIWYTFAVRKVRVFCLIVPLRILLLDDL